MELRDDWAHSEHLVEILVFLFAIICWTITKRSDAESDDEELRRDILLWILTFSIILLFFVIVINYVDTAYFRGVRLIIDTCVYAPASCPARAASSSCAWDGCLDFKCCLCTNGGHAFFYFKFCSSFFLAKPAGTSTAVCCPCMGICSTYVACSTIYGTLYQLYIPMGVCTPLSVSHAIHPPVPSPYLHLFVQPPH